jgi:hypothetical protein
LSGFDIKRHKAQDSSRVKEKIKKVKEKKSPSIFAVLDFKLVLT